MVVNQIKVRRILDPKAKKRKQKMKKRHFILLGFLLVVSCSGNDGTGFDKEKVGWAIGWDRNNSAVILHTNDSGLTWIEQGDRTQWEGCQGVDISAVDDLTAWAALAGTDTRSGMILHTNDGGLIWEIQTIPEAVQDTIKGIKGISRKEAWAASLNGTILHTVDGGQVWEIVPHPDVQITLVNRIDAIAPDNIWIADVGGGDTGMVHSSDGGETWRNERFPNAISQLGPIGVSAVSPSVVWSAISQQGDLYRTLDGGTNWEIAAPNLAGPFDFDDICAVSTDFVWAVLNLSGSSGGTIFRVRIENGNVISDEFSPAKGYQYEGITAFDDETVWAVGLESESAADATLPDGVIVHTQDGTNWTLQKLPEDDIELWKVSFVGAHR